MDRKQRTELRGMIEWVINKMFENHPDIEFCWDDLRERAADAWMEVTGIQIRNRRYEPND